MNLAKQLVFGWRAIKYRLETRDYYLRHGAQLYRQLFAPRFFSVALTGPAKHGAAPFRVLYLGEGKSLEYLQSVLFQEEPQQTPVAEYSLLQILRGVSPAMDGYDLAVRELTPRIQCLARARGAFELPEWVEQEIPLEGSWEDVVARFRKNTRSTDLRKVRKYNFGCDVVRDRPTIEYFHDQLYLPYISRRFQGAAEFIDRDWLIAVAERSGLLRILHGSEFIAGAVLHDAKDYLDWIWIGVAVQEGEDLQQGTFSTLYHHSIRHAHEHGFRSMKIGNTRPFLSDGVYRYKRKWGARLIRGRYCTTHWLFDFNFASEATRRWLSASPFLTQHADGLHAHLFEFGEVADSARLAAKRDEIASPGIAAVHVHGANATC